MSIIGILAAFGTAIGWASCGIFFTSASKRIGVILMNFHRTFFTAAILLVLHLIVFRTYFPSATNHQLLLIVASGILGLVLADSFLYKACVEIGPRLGFLIFSSYPIFSAFLAWIILGEKLKLLAWVGIIITLAGVSWVLNDEHRGKNKEKPIKSSKLILGITLALLGAIGQSLGLIFAKPVMIGEGAIDPFSVTLVRYEAALIVLCFFVFLKGKGKEAYMALKQKKVMIFILAGTIIGNVFGSWFSIVAVKLIPVGIASTIMATMPVLILPMVIFGYKERVTWRAAVGAIIVVIGVVILLNA